MTFIPMVLAALLSPALAGDTSRGLEYDVFDEDKRLGSITTEFRVVGDGKTAGTELVTRTRLKAKALFMTVFSLEDRSVYRKDIEGLVRFESTGRMDGDDYSVRVVRRDSIYLISASAGGETIEDRVDRRDFDFTSASEPTDHLGAFHESRTFRVLDLERLEIVARSFTWTDDEIVDVGGTSVTCRVIDIVDPLSRLRRWVACDDARTLVKEEGVDEDGAYRIVLRSYPEERP